MVAIRYVIPTLPYDRIQGIASVIRLSDNHVPTALNAPNMSILPVPVEMRQDRYFVLRIPVVLAVKVLVICLYGLRVFHSVLLCRILCVLNRHPSREDDPRLFLHVPAIRIAKMDSNILKDFCAYFSLHVLPIFHRWVEVKVHASVSVYSGIP